MATYESPRIRRLRSDLAALERLRAESSVLKFRVQKGDSRLPPQHYIIEFHGKSLARERGPVGLRKHHEVEIKLGASYPRTMPELRWLTPIYHPNISEIGMVCLGGYGTHWVPSLNLDELCGMLWDMARYHNYDIRSPYNREAALWVANQKNFLFPLDTRPLRDLRAALGRVDSPKPAVPDPPPLLEPVSAEPGSKAARYRDFLQKQTSGNGPLDPPTVWEPDEPEGELIFLDAPAELPTAPPRPRPSEEIVFLD
jgi:ubiquitin-protein ligase